MENINNSRNIKIYDFFLIDMNIDSINSINNLTRNSINDYNTFSQKNYKIENLMITEHDIQIYKILLYKKIIILKNICDVIACGGKIKLKKIINIEKLLIFLFSFINNKNFNNIQEIKNYEKKFQMKNTFFYIFYLKMMIFLLKNNIIKYQFCEVLFGIQFFYYINNLNNDSLFFIDLLINEYFKIEDINLKNNEINDFFYNIISFLMNYIIKNKNENKKTFYSFIRDLNIFKILGLLNLEKTISIDLKNIIFTFLSECLSYNLIFNHMEYLNLIIKKIIINPPKKSNIFFINNIFKLFKEIHLKETENIIRDKITEGIIFCGNKNNNPQIIFDKIFLKRNFSIAFSFLPYDISNIQILFSLCKKNNKEIFSIILEKNNLIFRTKDNPIIIIATEIKQNNKYFICLRYNIERILIFNNITIDIYFDNKLKSHSINLKIENDNLSIFLDFQKQIINNYEKLNEIVHFKGELNSIVLINEQLNQNLLNNLENQLNDDQFNIQKEYYGFEKKNKLNAINNNEKYPSIYLNINSAKIYNFLTKEKNKNNYNYILFKKNSIIEWFLSNDGISFITLILEYFYNLIFNSKKFEFEKEM